MSKDSNFTWRYISHLNCPSTTKVFGFDVLLAWTAAIFSTPAFSKLVATALTNDPTQKSAAYAIVNAIHARICISLGIQNYSTTSIRIFNDVAKSTLRRSPLKRYFTISTIPAAITALGALAYHTPVSPLPSLSELSCAVLGPSLIAYAASLLAAHLLRRKLTITLYTAQGPVTVKVHTDSPYYEILRLFRNSVSNPNNNSLHYTAQNIANKIAFKYRIQSAHPISDHMDGIPDPVLFARESREHPDLTTPMSPSSETPMRHLNTFENQCRRKRHVISTGR